MEIINQSHTTIADSFYHFSLLSVIELLDDWSSRTLQLYFCTDGFFLVFLLENEPKIFGWNIIMYKGFSQSMLISISLIYHHLSGVYQCGYVKVVCGIQFLSGSTWKVKS